MPDLPPIPGMDTMPETNSRPSFTPPPVQKQPQQPMLQTNKGGIADDISVEEYVEAVIEERWVDLEEDIHKIVQWKNKSEQTIIQLSQQVADLKDRFDKLHAALIGKIDSYDKNILEVGAEIKAMEKVFSKVLPVFTDNVKELSDITARMKR